MHLLYSFITRVQSRKTQYNKSETLRAIEELGLIVESQTSIIFFVKSKEMNTKEELIQERKKIESRFRMIDKNFSYRFDGVE